MKGAASEIQALVFVEGRVITTHVMIMSYGPFILRRRALIYQMIMIRKI